MCSLREEDTQNSPNGSHLVYQEVQEVRVDVPVGAAAGTTLLVQGIGADSFFLTVPKGIHPGGTFLALLTGSPIASGSPSSTAVGSQLKQRSLFSMLHSVSAPSENADESYKFAAVMDAAAAASVRAQTVTNIEEEHAIVVAVSVTEGANQGSVAVAEPVAWSVKTIASMPPGIKVRYKHRYSLSLSPLPPCLPPCLPSFLPPSLCH